jgi:hypothetical protein
MVTAFAGVLRLTQASERHSQNPLCPSPLLSLGPLSSYKLRTAGRANLSLTLDSRLGAGRWLQR